MLPNLTTGSINRIFEGEEVTGAVMQILGYMKISDPDPGNDCFQLLISDGVTACPVAMLGTQLNSLVINKELEKFTIVCVDKCVCNQIQVDIKVILLLNLVVLVPGAEVGKKIGNPIISSTSTSAVTTNTTENVESKSVSNAAPISISSTGSINKMLEGEEVTGAVMQILGYKKVPGTINGRDRYRLLISDGVTGYSFVMLSSQLSHLVTNKELEKFTIVRVDKCICHQDADRKVIILLNLVVLVPGAEIGEKIGNPTILIPSTSTSATNVKSKSVFNAAQKILSFGSIDRILKGEEVASAVMQILCYKKVPGTINGRDRYQLLISDGVTGCPFVMLGSQLSNLVTNKELEKFTIVRVDKYVYHQLEADRKVIILLELVVLFLGAEVGKEIGNPITSFTSTSAAITNTGANVKSKSVFNAALKIISSGSINRILEGEEVTGAVMQILCYQKIRGTIDGNDRYQLLLSDGVTACLYGLLSTQLNNLITNKELERFTVVRVDKCVCHQIEADRKVIVLLNLVVLFSGAEVGEEIGNPICCSISTSAASINTTDNVELKSFFNSAPKSISTYTSKES